METRGYTSTDFSFRLSVNVKYAKTQWQLKLEYCLVFDDINELNWRYAKKYILAATMASY